jgi:hypothetical protein
MRKLFKISAFVFLTLNFLGCSSDSSDDPCVPITCLNNGVSNSDCGCDCPQGYSGANCSTIVQPSTVTITKVVVKSFSNLNTSGLLWDGTNDADIYIKINSGTTVIYDHPSVFSNAPGGSNLNYQFILSPILQITNVNSPLIVSLWDYDLADIPSNPDDNMSSAPFFPFNGNGFPSTITITDPTNPTIFEISLSYQW